MRIRLNNSDVGSKEIDPAGGTVSAPLRLTGTPTTPLEAVSSSYVLNAASSFTGASVTGVFAAARLPAYTGTELSSAGNGIFTLSNTGVAAGTYAKVTVDTKGRVTGSGVLVSGDIPNLSYTKLIDRPTTLAGYGITDAVSLSGGVMTGALSLNGTPTDPTHLVSKAYVDTRVGGSGASAFVTGDVVSKSSSTTPSGFLRCNGGAVSRTTYAALFSNIGTIYNKAVSINSAGKPWKNQWDFNIQQTGNITDWNTGTALPGTVTEAQTLVTNNRAYLFAGVINGNASTLVYTAPINTDGALGTWTTGTALPAAVRQAQAIITKGRVHLLGGSGPFNSSIVYTAAVNPDGTLGTWSAGGSLPDSVYQSQAIVTSTRVYLLGGIVGGVNSSTVYTASINADGTLSAWTTGTSLPSAVSYSQAIVTNNRIYILGGSMVAPGNNATVYTAPINADGTLGTWVTGTSLPGTIHSSQAIVTRNRVYMLGGFINGNTNSMTYTAPINADGTLGTWTNGTVLPSALRYSESIVTKSRVYLLGGNNGGVDVSTVQVATFTGGFNDYTNYITQITTASTDFTLPDTTIDDAPGFFSYIKF